MRFDPKFVTVGLNLEIKNKQTNKQTNKQKKTVGSGILRHEVGLHLSNYSHDNNLPRLFLGYPVKLCLASYACTSLGPRLGLGLVYYY